MSTIANLKDEALDRIGRRIDAAWNHLRESKDAFLESSVELAQALREGRIHCGDNDRAFGAWLKETGRDYVNAHDRAALIKAAGNIAVMYESLTKTKSRSYRLIFGSPTKDRRRRKRNRKRGIDPQTTVNIEATVRAHKDRLNAEFERRINEEMRRRMNGTANALRKENQRLRDEILRLQSLLNRRGVFTKTQFRQLQMCVHPDSSASITVRNELTSFLVDNARQLVRS
jgi:hypothetical protein